MQTMILTLLSVALATPGASLPADGLQLTRLVREIRGADFRGERTRLRDLAAQLDRVADPALGAYREYWRGFALWRSAMNGANETPTPEDVRTDLEAALLAFRGSSKLSPDWIEPKIGKLFCWASLAFALPGGAAPGFSREEFGALAHEIEARGERNPRALWFIGGSRLFAPPPQGGDPAAAAEVYRLGLRAAREEALGRVGEEVPEWIPAWGAAENLMSLAYLYTRSPLEDHGLARAYAEGALAIAPDWHYVRDILLPQIEARPDGVR